MDVLLAVAHTAGIYLRQAPGEAFVVLLGSEGNGVGDTVDIDWGTVTHPHDTVVVQSVLPFGK